MRIGIVGCGAMGTLFGGLLYRSGHEVAFLDKTAERARYLKQRGLSVEGLTQMKFKAEVFSDAHQAGVVDLLIIFVKSYDTQQAAISARPMIGEDTIVLTLQNGLGNVEAIRQILPEAKIAAGVTSHGATLIEPGSVRHAGAGKTLLGPAHNLTTLQLRDVSAALAEAGVDNEIREDITSILWGKLIVNAAINPLTAIARVRNGVIAEDKHLRSVALRAAREGAAVASKKGIKLPYPDVGDEVLTVASKTAGNISSMLQDILKGKRTEIDAINGAIVREGKVANMDTPVNELLWLMVKGIEGRGGQVL